MIMLEASCVICLACTEWMNKFLVYLITWKIYFIMKHSLDKTNKNVIGENKM